MGLQITVLLSDIIYVDILQSTVPVFDSFGNSPLILSFFIVSIVMLTVCLLGMGLTYVSFDIICHISYTAYNMLHILCKNFHLHITMAPFKSQLTHFSFIIALHMKHETFLKQKLDLVEVLLRLVSNIDIFCC